MHYTDQTEHRMRPIQKQRIDDSVYERLLDNIKSGRWNPGDKLPSEGELCTMLQVSRVSVRSALQRLQALGFIEVKRAKGSFVCGAAELFDVSRVDCDVDLTHEEFREIAQLRGMLEEKSVEVIVSKKSGAAPAAPDFSAMEQAYQGMAAAVEAKDLDAFTLHDHQFHQAITLATGNSKFIRIAQIFKEDFLHYLREINKFVVLNNRTEERFRRYFDESLKWHTDLRNALHAFAPDAVDIQRRHILRNVERLDGYFRNRDLKALKSL